MGPRKGGLQIAIDAQDAEQGAGKTSEALALGRYFSHAFDWELSEDDMFLSGIEYLKRLRDHPGKEQPSVIYLDEIVGGGAGDARRSTSQINVILSRAWEMLRKKRIVSITTLSHFGDLDIKLKRFTSYRVYCMQPLGKCRPYKIGVDFDSGEVRTKRLDDMIYFPDMTDDPLYDYLDGLKDQTIDDEILRSEKLFDDVSSDDEEEDTGPSIDDLVEEVVEDPEPYTSIHGAHKTRYIDTELVRHAFDLSRDDAKTVKKLAEKEVEFDD